MLVEKLDIILCVSRNVVLRLYTCDQFKFLLWKTRIIWLNCIDISVNLQYLILVNP